MSTATTPTPTVVAWRVVDARGDVSLHHDRMRAEQAAVERHGLITELIVRPAPSASAALADAVHHMDLAMRLANRAVLADIETHSTRVQLGSTTWLDISHMLSPHEQPPEVLDMLREAIAYALDAGLCVSHFENPTLVRITPAGRRAGQI